MPKRFKPAIRSVVAYVIGSILGLPLVAMSVGHLIDGRTQDAVIEAITLSMVTGVTIFMAKRKDVPPKAGGGLVLLVSGTLAFGLTQACSGTINPKTLHTGMTVLQGALGQVIHACDTLPLSGSLWDRACATAHLVPELEPYLGQMGAGPMELPPDVASKTVIVTMGEDGDLAARVE